MKRSEMIQILKQATIQHMNCCCCTTDDEMYSKILYILEGAGMIPPFTPPEEGAYIIPRIKWELE